MIYYENRGTTDGNILNAGDFDPAKIDAQREAENERNEPSDHLVAQISVCD
jgi:hypothetical protein